MRQISADLAGSCIVRLSLQNGIECEIVTSAEHAKEILSGSTVIPIRIVSVFSRDGRRLNASDLQGLPNASANNHVNKGTPQ